MNRDRGGGGGNSTAGLRPPKTFRSFSEGELKRSFQAGRPPLPSFRSGRRGDRGDRGAGDMRCWRGRRPPAARRDDRLTGENG